MSWRTIALSPSTRQFRPQSLWGLVRNFCGSVLGLAAASLAGCGGPATLPWGETGDILKLSYYRVNTDPRTKKLEPTYRVVMSQSWREYRGDAPGEPFPKAAPGRVYSGFVSDAQMRACFADLTKAGIGTLRASEPESHNPHDLHRKAMSPAESEYTRVITIGTEKWHKSFYYRDQQSGRDLIEAFVRCEKYASAWVQMSILIHSEAVGPAFPRER